MILFDVQLLELVRELLSMLNFKLFVRDLFEAQTVVPLIVNGLKQVLLERLGGILFPEVLHCLYRAFRQVTLSFQSFKGLRADLVEFLGAECFIQFHAFNNCYFLSFTDIQLQGFV